MNLDNLHRNRQAAPIIGAIEARDTDSGKMLYRQYAEFYCVPMDDAIQDRTWAWLMAPDHPQKGSVAVLQTGKVVGLAHYRPFPEPLIEEEHGFLNDLFVAVAHLGQGLGRSLIVEVSAIAHKPGWPLVRWITAQDNTMARQLYNQIAQRTAWVTYELTLHDSETQSANTTGSRNKSAVKQAGSALNAAMNVRLIAAPRSSYAYSLSLINPVAAENDLPNGMKNTRMD